MFRKNKFIPELLKTLKKNYPSPQCALIHSNPLELLIATILSAQCTDERVNKVTPALFQRYKSAKEFSESDPLELETLIKSTGFYRNKAKSIRGMAKIVFEKYAGVVPDNMEALLELPGVARKTANVVLGTAFGRAEGVVVDTHVTRLSHRLGLSNKNSAEKIEKDLMSIVPISDWIWFSHALITHGRKICKARNPSCSTCFVFDLCPSKGQ